MVTDKTPTSRADIGPDARAYKIGPCRSLPVLDGIAATEIVNLANDRGCDLIVMGTHGATGLGRLLMGDVAEQVLRHAPCPVPTVKAPPAVDDPHWNRRPRQLCVLPSWEYRILSAQIARFFMFGSKL